MKKPALILLLALTACSKNPEPGESVRAGASTPEPATKLARTENHHENTLIAAAAALVREGKALSSELALRCWQREERRPNVREACLLAWSVGTEESRELETIVRGLLGAGPSRNTALAALRRPGLVATLPLSGLAGLLGALKTDPPWLRARAIRSWLATNDRPWLLDAKILMQIIALPAEAPDPLSLRETFQVARALRLSDDDSLRNAYCPPGAEDIEASRCLRFLSALVDPAGTHELAPELRILLPGVHNPARQFFARDYPERAILLGF